MSLMPVSIRISIGPMSHNVSRDEARAMLRHTHISRSSFDLYWNDASHDGLLQRAKVTEKIKRLEDESLERRAALKETGERQFRFLFQSSGVDCLSALPAEWRDEVVPKCRTDSVSLECVATLDDCMASFRSQGRFILDDKTTFDQTMTSVIKPFWRDVISMYETALESPAALKQVHKLLAVLAELYETAYDGIFLTQVQDGDPEGFAAFNRAMEEEVFRFLDGGQVRQQTTDIEILYDNAIAVRPEYNRLCEEIASSTGGEFKVAPLKHVFRAIEKTAMRADKSRRFECSNVYDVVRGALVYETMTEVRAGLKEVCDKFDVVRIKNRFFSVGDAASSGGWRDLVVNMRVKGDRAKHVVEVQIQLKCLLRVRSSLGGHFIYAKYRALAEALEVCGKN